VDDEVERRLARMEKRMGFAVVYASVAMIWVITQPEATEFARTLGLSPRLTQLIAAVIAGGFGGLFAAFILRRTSN